MNQRLRKLSVLVATALILASLASASELQNIEKITPLNTNNINVTGTVNMTFNPIVGISDLKGSGIVNADQIGSGAVSTTELDTGDVDTRYLLEGGDTISGNLDFTNSDNIQDSGTNAITFDGSQNVGIPNGNLNLGSGSNNGVAYFTDASSWTGNAGSGEGKLEYHSGRFYLNSGDSNPIVQFRNSAGNDQVIIQDGGNVDFQSNQLEDVSNIYSDDSSTDFFGDCSGSGNYIYSINSDGTVNCASDSSGTDDQNLKEVLTAGNTANQSIDMDGNSISNIQTLNVKTITSNKGSDPVDMDQGMDMDGSTIIDDNDNQVHVNDSLKIGDAGNTGNIQMESQSRIKNLGEISFDWQGSNSYDNPEMHGIESKDESGSWQDALSINSYSNAVVDIDSNANDGNAYFKVMKQGGSSDGTDLLKTYENGTLEVSNGNLNLANNKLTSVGSTDCASDEFIDGNGNCVQDSDTADDQNLKDVLSYDNSAGSYDIDMNGNNITDTGNITFNNSIKVYGDVWYQGSAADGCTSTQNLSCVLQEGNSAGSYNLDMNGNAIANADWSDANDLNSGGTVNDFSNAGDLNSGGSISDFSAANDLNSGGGISDFSNANDLNSGGTVTDFSNANDLDSNGNVGHGLGATLNDGNSANQNINMGNNNINGVSIHEFYDRDGNGWNWRMYDNSGDGGLTFQETDGNTYTERLKLNRGGPVEVKNSDLKLGSNNLDITSGGTINGNSADLDVNGNNFFVNMNSGTNSIQFADTNSNTLLDINDGGPVEVKNANLKMNDNNVTNIHCLGDEC